MDVGCIHRGHLAALDFRRAAFRMQDEDLDIGAAAAGFDRCGAGVAGRRTDDGDLLFARLQHVLEQQPDQLQREILERQRRPVEELQQPFVGTQLLERGDGGVRETRIGLLGQPRQILLDHRAGDKRRHHFGGEARVVEAGEGGQVGGAELRPGFRHIETAVGGKTRQQDIVKAERRRPAAGGDIAQGRSSGFRPAGDTPRVPGRQYARPRAGVSPNQDPKLNSGW